MKSDSTKSSMPGKTSKQSLGRRDLLKALVAGGSAIAVATMIPNRWTKPAIEVGVMPAHAQTSSFGLAATADQLSGPLCFITGISVTMSPAVNNVEIQMTITGSGAVPSPNAFTNASGVATFADVAMTGAGPATLNFSFVDSATYGSSTASLGPYTLGEC